MTALEFYRAVFPSCDVCEDIKENDYELNIEQKYLERISEYLASIDDPQKRMPYFKDIIAKPNTENGKLFELLVYAWLKKKYFSFQEQILIKSDDCLKKNDYYADGTFSGIVFDIKNSELDIHYMTALGRGSKRKLMITILLLEGKKI